MKKVIKHHLFWPISILLALLLFNFLYSPDFFSIVLKGGKLYGSLIDILNFGAPLILVSIGMTLVIATKGIDLSVGSIIAITGALSCLIVSKGSEQSSLSLVLSALGLAILLSLLLGLWNGVLVAKAGIQPIIATLILMVAGRGIAQLITGGQIITVNSSSYSFLGTGALFSLPVSIFVVAIVLTLSIVFTRKSAMGLFIESVGNNPEASRLAGIRSTMVILLVYVCCGLCAGIAGLLVSSNVSSADGNNAGLWFELDAILAVVIGGTSLNGGRFYLMGTVIGALIIQTLTTTIYMIGIPPEITLVVKACVVLIVCLIQSEAFRKALIIKWKTRHYTAEREVPTHVNK